MIQVVVYSKPGCHLCDKVKAQLEKLRQSYAFEWREHNILDHPGDFERFKNDVPVVFINGRMAFKHRLDEAQFLKRLERMERGEDHGAA